MTILPKIVDPLLRELDRESPRVLIVIGTGVAFGATGSPCATWRGLLQHGVSFVENAGLWDDAPSANTDLATAERTLIDASFRPGKFDLDEVLQRADSISKNLGAPNGRLFSEWLAASVGQLKAQGGRVEALESLRDLADAGALLLTTNYDSLLTEVTGLPPVTWEEPGEILKVINRERSGILHIHGQWERPSSVVLGGKSYDQIVAAKDLQDVFKSLWLHWHWLYVGCGGGLDDPNVGRLLRWGRETFGDDKMQDFFLGQDDTIRSLAPWFVKSKKFVSVAYSDHAKLPAMLSEMTPQARCDPFVTLKKAARLPVRDESMSAEQNPFPSWREYEAGDVPPFAADVEVVQRLEHHGWAFVLDVASVGKTTLALRLATARAQANHPVYYLNLGQVPPDDAEFQTDASRALKRLARDGSLLILDDAHHAPALARHLWNEWQTRANGSRLLVLATKMERLLHLPGDTDLVALKTHGENPAISLRPIPPDLLGIMRYVLKRLNSSVNTNELNPPPAVLDEWHRDFGGVLGAFVNAVTQYCGKLEKGIWPLPATAAGEWMRRRHLDPLTSDEHDNAICLAVLGAQDLELDVPKDALPHPDAMDQLLNRGLAEKTGVGGGRWVRFGLRDPSWGNLIVGAAQPPAKYSTDSWRCRFSKSHLGDVFEQAAGDEPGV